MKKRIWKRYLYLFLVGLAVCIGEREKKGEVAIQGDLVQAFAMDETDEDLSFLLLQMENENIGRVEQEQGRGEESRSVTQEMVLREQLGLGPAKEEPKDGDLVSDGEDGQRFIPHEKVFEYDWEALQEYKNLIAIFYAIDASTATNSGQLNVEALLGKNMTIDKDLGPYQILVYHSHSKEAFADSEPGEVADTIVGMGERLAELLEEYGYSVLHHTARYDTFRDDAYEVALPEIERLLSENPSIQVVIDLHRDAGVEGVSRTTVIDGKEYAKFMLFNGMSYNRKKGKITYLDNPNLEDNLAFSFQVQVKAGEYYPGLTRKIYLKAYRYNMHVKPKTLLIELGDSNCTVSQARNTLEPLAHILDLVLSGE